MLILKATCTRVGRVWLVRLTSKANTTMQKNWIIQTVFSGFPPRALISTCDSELPSHPAQVWAYFLIVHTGLMTCFCIHQTGFKPSQSVYSLVEQFKNQLKAWNLAEAQFSLVWGWLTLVPARILPKHDTKLEIWPIKFENVYLWCTVSHILN